MKEITDKMLGFVEEIGIPVVRQAIVTETVLPGIAIMNGAIVVDVGRLLYPGDILHEAGHIAIVPAADRSTLSAETIGTRKDRAAEEMMSIAWSYAASIHLDIDQRIFLHPDGYHGGAEGLLQSFAAGNGVGVPMLQYVGLTRMQSDDSATPPYPHMLHWLRD
jgi:hypothetical protein